MTLRAVVLSFVLCLSYLVTWSQDTTQTSVIKYYNRTFTGILAGGQHGLITGSLTTAHGVSVGRFALAAGTGLEGYERWRTIPIFGSMAYYFRGVRKKGMFLQIQGGHSICRLLTADEWIDIDGTKGGAMFSSTIGYQIASNKLSVNIAAGYKMQKMRGGYSSPWSPLAYSIDEKTDRFIFQIGFGIL